eukprot:Nk52_evm16s280 gene=Nk52_evmTU16s280
MFSLDDEDSSGGEGAVSQTLPQEHTASKSKETGAAVSATKQPSQHAMDYHTTSSGEGIALDCNLDDVPGKGKEAKKQTAEVMTSAAGGAASTGNINESIMSSKQSLEGAIASDGGGGDSATTRREKLISRLESELACDQISLANVRKLCQLNEFEIPDKLRAKVWHVLLACKATAEPVLTEWKGCLANEKDQARLEKDCEELVKAHAEDLVSINSAFTNENELKKIRNSMVRVVSFHCSANCIPYDESCKYSYCSVVFPFLCVGLTDELSYKCLLSMTNYYIPRDAEQERFAFSIIRMLLLYHDPVLLRTLETMSVRLSQFCHVWVKSCFIELCSLPVAIEFIDRYLLYGEPFLVFFMTMIFVLNMKDVIMDMTVGSEVIDSLIDMPSGLSKEDLKDFFDLAFHYIKLTPMAMRTDYGPYVFSLGKSNRKTLPDGEICLHTSVKEVLMQLYAKEKNKNGFSYVLIDCRSKGEFDKLHLPTAYHLDNTLMVRDVNEFELQVDKLTSLKEEHLCLMGSGGEDEEQYLGMMLSYFLKRKFQYVSYLFGGFQEVQRLLKRRRSLLIAEELGSAEKELASKASAMASKASEKLSMFSSAFKEKTMNLSTKLGTKINDMVKKEPSEEIEVPVDPENEKEKPAKESKMAYFSNRFKQSSSSMLGMIKSKGEKKKDTEQGEQKGRETDEAVFTIGDEEEEEERAAETNGRANEIDESILQGPEAEACKEDHTVNEIVNVYEWFAKDGILKIFPCNEIKRDGNMHPSYLAVSETEITKLTGIPEKQGCAYLRARRPIVSIAKISAKKKHPNLICLVFKIEGGIPSIDPFPEVPSGKFLVIAERFMIPESSEFTALLTKTLASAQGKGE